MTNYYIPNRVDALEHVVTAEVYVKQSIPTSKSLFIKRSVLRKCFVSGLLLIIRVIRILLKRDVYFLNTQGDFFSLDPIIKKQLSRLTSLEIISTWQIQKSANPKLDLVHIELTLKPIRLAGNRHISIDGTQGSGVSNQRNILDGFKVAIAESLERYSVAAPSQKLVSGTYSSLKKMGAVHPKKFYVKTERQEVAKDAFHDEDVIEWVVARDLKGKKCFIPAQINYIFFHMQYPESVVLQEDVSTNGAAAHSIKSLAKYYSLCEVIERDAFLIHWLRQITPCKIEVASIPYNEIQHIIDQIDQTGFEVFVLDITTDFLVPVILVVAIHRTNRVIYHGTSSDISIKKAIYKATLDVARLIEFKPPGQPSMNKPVPLHPMDIHSISTRRQYWSSLTSMEVYNKYSFLLKGNYKKYTASSSTQKDALTHVCNVLLSRDVNGYIVDTTHPHAKKEGLWVFKAHIIGALQMYFREDAKPVDAYRLLSRLQFPDQDIAPIHSSDLNPNPHPFL